MYIKLILANTELFSLKTLSRNTPKQKLTYTLTVRSNKNAAAGNPAAAFLSLDQIPTLVTKQPLKNKVFV